MISMVPSWTETLIAAGANVVGRTRFCVHPKDAVAVIPSFGGTKTLADKAEHQLREMIARGKKWSSFWTAKKIRKSLLTFSCRTAARFWLRTSPTLFP